MVVIMLSLMFVNAVVEFCHFLKLEMDCLVVLSNPEIILFANVLFSLGILMVNNSYQS